MDDFKDNLDVKYAIFEAKARPWFFRLIGALAGIGFLWSFFDPLHSSFMERIGSGFLVGLGTYLILYMAGFLLNLVLRQSVEYAAQSKNPFVQGLKFIFFAFICFGVIDVALLGGNFIAQPVLVIIASGSLEGTYWGCDNWRVIEDYEGITRSFCDDDNY